MVTVTKTSDRPKVVNVHRLIVYLSRCTDQEVPVVKCCPTCSMPEFSLMYYAGAGVLCNTCNDWCDEPEQLVTRTRTEFLKLVRTLPLFNNGIVYPIRPWEEDRQVTYDDLSMEQKDLLDSLI